MRFSYYERLSKKEQAAYRKSDAKTAVPLPDAPALRPLALAVAPALQKDDVRAVQAATKALVDALLAQLGAPPVTTRVLAVRPHDDGEELHGLYVLEEDGRARLRVWMRTAAQRRPVAFRTFVRTVLHEVCHHLDFTVFDLDPSFHTEGFFKRESHLTRQLLGAPAKKPGASSTTEAPDAALTDDVVVAGAPAGARQTTAPRAAVFNRQLRLL